MSPLSRGRALTLGAAFLIAALAACGSDPFAVTARLDVLEDTLTVHAINDESAAPELPVALDISTQRFGTLGELIREPRAEPISNAYDFDVAFDVRGDTAILLTPRRVASPFGFTRRVGVLAPTATFEALTRAPGSGYLFDTVAVKLREGGTAVVVSAHPDCASEVHQELYAKVGILDVDPVAKTVTFRVRLDPNCGFRSFLPGVPRS